MHGSLNDRFSLHNQHPVFVPAVDIKKEDSPNDDERSGDGDFSSGQPETPELAVIRKLVAGERIEPAPEHQDLGEFADDNEDILRGAMQHIASQDNDKE